MICPNCGQHIEDNSEHCCFCGICIQDTLNESIYAEEDIHEKLFTTDEAVQLYRQKFVQTPKFDESFAMPVDEPRIRVISIPISARFRYTLWQNKKKLRKTIILLCCMGVVGGFLVFANNYYNEEYINRCVSLAELLPGSNKAFTEEVARLNRLKSMGMVMDDIKNLDELIAKNKDILSHHPKNYVFPMYWEDDKITEKIINNHIAIYETARYIALNAATEDVSKEIESLDSMIKESQQLADKVAPQNADFHTLVDYGDLVSQLQQFQTYAPTLYKEEQQYKQAVIKQKQQDAEKAKDVEKAKKVFELYHEYITDHNFTKAYSLLSSRLKQDLKYEPWANGFKNTIRSTPTRIDVVSATSNQVELSFALEALDQDSGIGMRRIFVGNCRLIKEDNMWAIDYMQAKEKS